MKESLKITFLWKDSNWETNIEDRFAWNNVTAHFAHNVLKNSLLSLDHSLIGKLDLTFILSYPLLTK